MFKNKIKVLAAIGIAVMLLSGCASVTINGNTLQSNNAAVAAYSRMVGELEFGDKKVIGIASGDISDGDAMVVKATLESNAANSALKNGGDVLVGANFFYETVGDILTVTVVGYPAKYKGFKPMKKNVATEVSQSTNVQVSNNLQQENENIKITNASLQKEVETLNQIIRTLQQKNTTEGE